MLAWLRLLRISALPTAISNILVGYLVAHQSWLPIVDLLLLITASSCLYLSGMISNDVFDFQRDMMDRPHRPLTSGAVSVRAATLVFTGLMALAAVCGLFVNVRSLILISIIIVCIFLYNGPLKTTLMAPLIMGACRALNILLGASTAGSATTAHLLGFSPTVWWIAISLGILITGITLFARHETRINTRGKLIFSTIIIIFGIAGWATVAKSHDLFPDFAEFFIAPVTRFRYPILVAFISIPIARRLWAAISSPQPRAVQMAVITMLRSLIIFDAAVCFLVMPDQLLYPLAVLSLIVPAVVMTKFVPPT